MNEKNIVIFLGLIFVMSTVMVETEVMVVVVTVRVGGALDWVMAALRCVHARARNRQPGR
jgi:hypothetical protein